MYIDSEGDKRKTLHVSKDIEQGGLVLRLKSEQKDSRHYYKPPGSTQDWKLVDHAEKHDFHARRQNNKIVITGTYQGKPLNKVVEVDDKPWINKLDHGLSSWVRSNDDHIVFWTLKLNSGLDAIQFEAEKLGTETVLTAAGEFETIKVKLNLHGFLVSNFWSAHCWYRKSDGLFVRYEGDSGPGTHIRTIELKKIL